MNFQSFVADGKDYRRAGDLLLEAKRNQKDKEDDKDCTDLIEDVLLSEFRGKTFVEARTPAGQLCAIALFDDYGTSERPSDDIYVEFLCSDCLGTGRQMIEELNRLARGLGKTWVRLTAVPRSVKFYEKTGFEEDPDASKPVYGKNMRRRTGGGRTYRRRRQRKHGSASVRRHKTRRVLEGQVSA